MSGNGTFSGNEIPLSNRRIFEVIPSLYQIKQGQGDDLLRSMLGENQFGFTQTSGGKDIELIYRTPLLWPDTLYDNGTNINDTLSKYKQGFVSFKPEYSNVAYTSLKIRYPDRAKQINPSLQWSNIKLVKSDSNNDGNNINMTSSDLYSRNIIVSEGTSEPNSYAVNQQVTEFLKGLGYSLKLSSNGVHTNPQFSMHDDNNNTINVTGLWVDSIKSIIDYYTTVPSNTYATELYVNNSITNSENNISNNFLKKLDTVPLAGQFVVTKNSQLSLTTLPTSFNYNTANEKLTVTNIDIMSDLVTVNPIKTSGLIIKTNGVNPNFPLTLVDSNDIPYLFNFKYNGVGLSILKGSDELLHLSDSSNITIPNTISFLNNGTNATINNRVLYKDTVKEIDVSGVENLPDDALLTKSEVLLLIQAAQTSFTPIGG